MSVKEEILQLSKEEKVKLMEAIWEDLSRDDSLESPDWHKDELDKTGASYERGEIEALDWENVKKELMRERNEKG